MIKSLRMLCTVLLLPSACLALAQQQAHVQNSTFGATVTGFQTTGGANGWHYITATVHFVNLTKKPLILAANPAKATSTDNKGNIYGTTSMRGIGGIASGRVDASFVLPPGGGGDVLLNMQWRPARNVEFGITFDLDLAVSEIEALESGQVRIGKETVLHFGGLKSGYFDVPPDHTVDAGPFTAHVVRTKLGTAGRFHTVDITVSIKNTSDKPLILAYDYRSDFGTDDAGNRYGFGNPGGPDASASGIGVVGGGKADPQFELKPGEEREARFRIVRAIAKVPDGKELTFYVALKQLEILPSKQIREVRQFSLAFPGLPAS
ncbi:MAG: hypothetical protein M9921_11825 [Fimbriimonadaceae bacterium]|nr:hypothetical protein [Chthonomonadaceae bacterium]MCO5297535.1 hypothetical protein [Fimbriimonadaceae bacterium]